MCMRITLNPATSSPNTKYDWMLSRIGRNVQCNLQSAVCGMALHNNWQSVLSWLSYLWQSKMSNLDTEIKGPKDLNKKSVKQILQNHFRRCDVEVLDIGALGGMDGINDAFNSEIKKAAIRYKFGQEEGNIEELHVILKLPSANRAMKYTHKVIRPFLFETLWYSR